jgi:hypothetical protein
VPASVFAQLESAGQLTTLNLKEKMPFEPLGLLMPEKDTSLATQSIVKFLQAFCE